MNKFKIGDKIKNYTSFYVSEPYKRGELDLTVNGFDDAGLILSDELSSAVDGNLFELIEDQKHSHNFIESGENTNKNNFDKMMFDSPLELKNTPSEFIKNSSHKIQTTLIDPHFTEELATCLTKGAAKYAPNNWKLSKQGIKDFLESMDRHLLEVKKYLVDGDIKHLTDDDSNDHQGFHIGANAMFLSHFIRKELIDNGQSNTI